MFDNLRFLWSSEAALLITKARKATYQGQHNSAFAIIQELIDDYPNAAFPYLIRAEIYTHKADYNNGLTDVERYFSLLSYLGTIHTTAYKLQGICLHLLGQYEKSLEPLLKAHEAYPNNIEVMRFLGRSYYELQKLELAEKMFKQALLTDADNTVLLQNLAFVYQAAKKTAEAQQCYHRILNLYPKHPEGLLGLAGLFYENNIGDPKEILHLINTYFEVVNIHEAPKESLCSAAFIRTSELIELKRYVDAKTSTKQLVEFGAKKDDLLRIHSKIEMGLNNKDEAKKILHELINSYPDNDIDIFKLSTVYFEEKSYDLALKYILEFTKKNPNDIKGLINRGNIYMALSKYTEAIADFEKLISLSPKNLKDVIRNSAIANDLIGNHHQAEIDYKLCKKLFPDDLDIRILYADFYLKTGDVKNIKTKFTEQEQNKHQKEIEKFQEQASQQKYNHIKMEETESTVIFSVGIAGESSTQTRHVISKENNHLIDYKVALESAKALVKQGHYEKAEILIKQHFQQTNPNIDHLEKAEWLYLRSQIFSNYQQYSNAEKDLIEAMKLAPDQPEYANVYGEVLMLQKNFDDAATCFENLLDHTKQSHEETTNLHKKIAIAYFMQGLYGKAFAHLTPVLKSDSSIKGVEKNIFFYFSAAMHAKLGDYPAAIKDIDTIIASKYKLPNVPEQFALAILYYCKEDYVKSQQTFLKEKYKTNIPSYSQWQNIIAQAERFPELLQEQCQSFINAIHTQAKKLYFDNSGERTSIDSQPHIHIQIEQNYVVTKETSDVLLVSPLTSSAPSRNDPPIWLKIPIIPLKLLTTGVEFGASYLRNIIQDAPKHENSSPKTESGVAFTKTPEPPCFYPESETNIIRDIGDTPKDALITPCKQPKYEPQQNSHTDSSIVSSFTSGFQNGFIYNYLYAQFRDVLDEPSARLAAQGAIVAILFNVSPTGAVICMSANLAGTQAANIALFVMQMSQGSLLESIGSTLGTFVGSFFGDKLAKCNLLLEPDDTDLSIKNTKHKH